MRLYLIFVLLTINLNSCDNESEIGHDNTTYSNNEKRADYNIVTFKNGTTWGYDIYKDNNLLIHQPNIPAIEGNDGFFSESDAMTVANFVVYKLENGIMPPSISLEELDSLKIIQQSKYF